MVRSTGFSRRPTFRLKPVLRTLSPFRKFDGQQIELAFEVGQ